MTKTEFIEGHCESCGMTGDVRRCKIDGKEHPLCLSCKRVWTGHGW